MENMQNMNKDTALRLVEMLEEEEWPSNVTVVSYARECVAELRRQHARITELEAQLAQRFDAADMATAAAQGFMDGAAKEQQAGWVSVDERLPGEQGQDSEEVMLFINGHCKLTDMECRQGGAWGLRLGYFDADRQAFRVHGRPEPHVTHWRQEPPAPPIPAAPNPADGESNV